MSPTDTFHRRTFLRGDGPADAGEHTSYDLERNIASLPSGSGTVQ